MKIIKNKSTVDYNVGRILNIEMIEELKREAKALGAEMFTVAE